MVLVPVVSATVVVSDVFDDAELLFPTEVSEEDVLVLEIEVVKSAAIVTAVVGDGVGVLLLVGVTAIVEGESVLVREGSVVRESVAPSTVVVGNVDAAAFVALVDVTTGIGENVLVMGVVVGESVVLATAEVCDAVDLSMVVEEEVLLVCEVVIGDSIVCVTVVVGDVCDVAVLVDVTTEVSREDVLAVVVVR